MGLLERIRSSRGLATTDEQLRYSMDGWIQDYLIPSSFQYQGSSYPIGLGLKGTLSGNRAMEVADSLPGYSAALRHVPPAFAAQLVRALVLSQVRFTFRNKPWGKTPRREFSTAALQPLEVPWTSATTGELVSRMEWHAGLAGAAFVAIRPQRNQGQAQLQVLRPDWVGIVWGSDSQPDNPGGARDGKLLGYYYCNGGFSNQFGYQPEFLLPDECIHWAPIPDPLGVSIGMSWLTSAIRDMQSDKLAGDHKIRYWENGAAQGADSRVLTPSGWTRMGDISVGDYVTGPDGKPREVLGVYPQGEKDIYRVTFVGGASAESCEDHLWQVATYEDRKQGTYRVKSLREIMAAGISYTRARSFKWSVPLVDPIEYVDAGPLPLHPYLLGSLLGDGSFSGNGKGSGSVSMAAAAADADEQQALLTSLLPDRVSISRNDRGGWSQFTFRGPGGPRPNPLTVAIRELGLYGVRGPEKSIPDVYMHAAVTDRVALLQGLIDTDGHVNHGKYTGVAFCTTSEKLALQLQELVRGLGGMATCKPAGLRPKDPNRRPQWRLYISRLPEWIIPVRLERKRAHYKSAIRGGVHRHQYIESIEFVRREPAQCIKVDADDGLYVTDDFVVTHNTPNLVIKGLPAVTRPQFDELVDMMEERHAGAANAFRTLYLTQGADASVIGNNFHEIDFRAVTAAGETRISVLSRVPASLLGITEGLQGSTLNTGNFSAARRTFADTWVYPTLQDLAKSLAPLVKVPGDAELWYDTTDIGLLREDAKDQAEIDAVKAGAIRNLVDGGFDPKSAIATLAPEWLSSLRHTGNVSVQLQPPGVNLQNANEVGQLLQPKNDQ